MLPVHLVLQTELLRDRALRINKDLATTFSSDVDWRQELRKIDDMIADTCRPFVIASIEVCEYIRKHHAFLARGVIADFDICRFSRSMSIIPRDIRLNHSYIMLPFGEIEQRIPLLTQAFGDTIFLKPESSKKSFTGFSCSIEELPAELSSLRQIQHVRDHELCVIDVARPIMRTEFRAWIIDGQVPTISSYSHLGPTNRPAPAEIWNAARKLAEHLEMIDNALVVDFATLPNGDVKVVEINAPSTSGVYANADLNQIIRSVGQILI